MAISDNAIPRPRLTVLADALPGDRVRDVGLVAGYALFIGVLAQLYVLLPFTPVPISGQTFAVLLGAAALGWRRALAGTVLYLAVGVAGVPWFSEGTGGTASWSLASFGYIIGFTAAAALVGALAARGLDRTPLLAAVTMVAGNLVIYAFGVPWLMAVAGVGLADGVALGVVPFLLGDAIKVLLAAGLLPAAWFTLRTRAGRRA
jgi:biotin transport system substrate-specific component